MFFTGIADEAGKSIDTQIKAHQALGWKHIELRLIDDYNLASLPEPKYEEVKTKLQSAGLTLSCFASAIANWAKKISGDFNVDLTELKNGIPRMKELGAKFVRIMSYPNDNWSDADWFKEVVRRTKEMSRIAEDSGIILVHENCSGWGGQSPEHTLQLLDTVNSPALKLVYDTGNPPAEGQDGWDFYTKVKAHIVYVHIKDAKMAKHGEKVIFTYPGEGDGYVKEIVSDLLKSGYNGGFSIEPHLAAIVHEAKDADDATFAFREYVGYGGKLMEMMKSYKFTPK